MRRRGLMIGSSVMALTTIGASYGLVSHHLYWMEHCCKNPDILSFNDEHTVHNVETLKQPYKPTWYFTNSHVQTVMNAVLRMPKLTDLQNLDIERTKHTFTDSGATIYLDWITPARRSGTDWKEPSMTLFIMPGVVSGTDGVGILNLVESAIEKNYRCIVFNYMSKEGFNVITKEEYPTLPGVTHGISDLKNILRVIENELGPNCKMVAVGVSLGANALVQYIGEQSAPHVPQKPPKYFKGEKPTLHLSQKKHPFTACISLGNPYDLDLATNILHSNKLHHYLYDSFFVQRRKEMVRMSIINTTTRETQEFDNYLLSKLDECDTTRELDERVSLPMLHRQMQIEGRDPSSIPDLHTFYSASSSKNWVEYVDVPLLSINARDDPISRYEAIPIHTARFNKNISFVVTECGGHVGWLDTLKPFTMVGYKESYAERAVMEFLGLIEQQSINKINNRN
jgi:predicted alpha/beta-fold hydrolase